MTLSAVPSHVRQLPENTKKPLNTNDMTPAILHYASLQPASREEYQASLTGDKTSSYAEIGETVDEGAAVESIVA